MIAFVGFCFQGLAQTSLADVKAPILAAKELYFNKANVSIDAVNNFNGHPEFWYIDQIDDRTRSFRISWYNGKYLHTELYLVQSENLIYALEEIKTMSFNQYAQSVWRCEYFIKGNTIIDYVSLGHGKTEDDTWEPESILIQFGKRKAELAKIRK